MEGGEGEGEEKIASGSERYICLRVSGIPGCKWYLMDLDELNKTMETEKKKKKKNRNKKKINIISNDDDDDDDEDEEEGYYSAVPPFLSIRHSEYSAFSVSTGTNFYFLGGYVDRSVEDDDDDDDEYDYESWDTSSTKASRRAFRFDATNPDQGFVAAPSMLHGRAGCRALAFKGKIYVFCGPALRRESFGEFFDPESQKWTKIDPPPAVVVGSGSGSDLLQPAFGGQIAFPYDEKNLLVGPFASKDDRYRYWLYNVISNSWTVCPESPFIFFYYLYSQPVKVGNTLYYRLEGDDHKDGDICALDLESGIHYRGPVLSNGRRDRTAPFVAIDSLEPTLFHLGGDDFCFFTILKPSETFYPATSHIRCTKVRVVLSTAAGFLNATIISTLLIPVSCDVTSIMDTTPVDEIFVKTLLPVPDNEKVDRSDLLTHIGRWVLGIGVLGLLSVANPRFMRRNALTGGKQCVSRHAEGLHLDKQAAVHKDVIAEGTLWNQF